MTDKTPTQYEQAKKKRGSKPASIAHNYTGSKTEIGKIIENSTKYFGRPPVMTDEECAIKIAEFFEDCAKNNSFPTIEKMALALGVCRETLWRWETGALLESTQRSQMIKQAKEILASIDAELVLKNKIREISYIFRAKNYYNMHDKQEHVITTPNNPLGDLKSETELIERYQDALPEIIE